MKAAGVVAMVCMTGSDVSLVNVICASAFATRTVRARAEKSFMLLNGRTHEKRTLFLLELFQQFAPVAHFVIFEALRQSVQHFRFVFEHCDAVLLLLRAKRPEVIPFPNIFDAHKFQRPAAIASG